MPRRKRRDYPGAWHHVTNRGIARRTIFEREADVRYFQSRLARAVRRGEIEVHSYSLLTTHFHMQVRSVRGELATAMQRIQGEFSRYFNRGRKRDGPLYRARYFSGVIECRAYFDNVVRYIDGNAVHAGLVASPECHAASSAYWYARGDGPLWLSMDLLYERARQRVAFDEGPAACYRKAFVPHIDPGFREWIERRLERAGSGPDPLKDLIAAVPERILAWMRRKAHLADGTGVGLPLVPWNSVVAELHESVPCLLQAAMRSDHRACSIVDIAKAGLLREVACLTLAQIALLCEASLSGVQRRIARHRAELRGNDAYAIAVADVVHRAIQTIG